MAVDLVVVGASWGGLHAVGHILAALPADFPVPIAVAQHRSPRAPDGLAEILQQHCAIQVRDAEDKDPIGPGARVSIAPSDYHLLVARQGYELSVDERVHHARPSIDVLFESAAEVYGARVIGVLLTGANEDGTAGLRRIRQEGGTTIVQEPATAERARMPQAAITAGVADVVVPLEGVAAAIVEACRSGRRPAWRGVA